REPEEWNIIDFLKECNNLGSYQQIILCYISSLDEIIKTKEGVEAEKAQKLFDHYKKASELRACLMYKSLRLTSPGHGKSSSLSDAKSSSQPDCTLARNWWDKHTKVDQSSIHMQITGIETINVNTSASKKRTFLEIDELNTTNNEDINEFDDENIINEEQVKGHNLEESW
ncbi:3351_t:CDS:2, partial [Acaulospora morrowiae]